MIRQQAGVSAEADGLDVPFWNWWKQSGFLPACSLVAHAAWKAALATAPPEQARCSVVLTKEGDRCAAEAGHEGAHELDLTADQPQAVSAGALGDLITAWFDKPKVLKGHTEYDEGCAATYVCCAADLKAALKADIGGQSTDLQTDRGVPSQDTPRFHLWEEVYKLHQKEGILMGEALKRVVAAHDQKVRTEVLLDASRLISGSCKDDGSETDEALTWAASRIRLLAETGK